MLSITASISRKEKPQKFRYVELLADAPKATIEDALKDGPKFFRELMEATGSDDGREIVRELEQYYASGRLKRLEDGRYALE